MATTETLEQVLKLLIEDTKRYRQRTEEDTRLYRQRAEESAARVDKSLAELSEQSKKTQLELQSLAQQTQAELDSLSKEVKATTKQVKETNKQMGELSNRMGTLVEDMVSPDMLRILRQVANIPEEVEGVVNVRVQRLYRGSGLNGHAQKIEFDAVAECGDYVLVNETKTTLRPEHVKDFIMELGQLRDYFPEFVGKKIIGAVASLRIDPSLRVHASRQGLLVLALGEGMLQLQNEAGFQPKIF
jgi:hypothetical protein